MCFGGEYKNSSSDPLWYGYIDDGKGWNARPKSEYMKTPMYNSEHRGQGNNFYKKVQSSSVPMNVRKRR